MPRRLLLWLLCLLGISLTLLTPPGAVHGAGTVPVLTVTGGVSAQATAENSQRKLLVDGRGRLFLVYVAPVGGTDQLFLAESTDGGRVWRRAQVTSEAEAARLPSLALAPDGSLHLVWTEYTPVGRVYWRVRRGGRWAAPQAISAPGVYAGVPVVAVAGGRPHALWYGILPERPSVPTRHGSIYEIVSTRQQAAAWTVPVSISPGVPDSLNPALDVDAGGLLHAAWWQFDGRAYQIRYTRFDRRWSTARTLTGGGSDHTNVALDVDGREVHLVWVDHGAGRRIMYAPLERAASPLSGPGDAHDPVVAAAAGSVVAAWRQGGATVFRRVRPAGPVRILGEGSGEPAVALWRQTAYVAWTATVAGRAEVRFAAVPVR